MRETEKKIKKKMEIKFISQMARLRMVLESNDTENLSKLLKENKYLSYTKIDYMIENAILKGNKEVIEMMREYFRDNDDREWEFNLMIAYESMEEIDKFYQKYAIFVNLKEVFKIFFFSSYFFF